MDLLPNVGPYIYDVSISGFTRRSIYIYIYDISSLRVNNQLDVLFNVFIYLFHISSCFEQPSAHHRENQLYQYII